MDRSVYSCKGNLLNVYGINFDINNMDKAKIMKDVKAKIDRLLKTTRTNAIINSGKNSDGTVNEDMTDIRAAEKRRIKEKHDEMMKSDDVYELIAFYIQEACDDLIFSLEHKTDLNDPRERETFENSREWYNYIRIQLSTPEDVREYIENVLPYINSVDIGSINPNHTDGGQNISGKAMDTYKYAVSMYPEAKLLLDSRNESEILNVYSFGVYRYKTPITDVIEPYEILGIVKKDRNGNSKAYTGVMRIRECKTVEVNNMQYSSELNQSLPFSIKAKDSQNKGESITVKYTEPVIPEDMIAFFRDIVCSDMVLENAKNNYGAIGIVEKGTGVSKYGKYRLVFNEVGFEDFIQSLVIASSTTGKITGMDTSFYGNNLEGVLLMAKYAALARGEKINPKQLEQSKEVGMTQGE